MSVLIGIVTIIGFLSAMANATAPGGSTRSTTFASPTRVKASYCSLPLSFEPNEGQTDPRVRFLARGPGYTLFLTADEAVLSLRSEESEVRTQEQVERPWSPATRHSSLVTAVVRLKLLGADPGAEVTGLEELPGKSNYFLGNDPGGWHTDVPTYAKVRYQGLYRGVDAVYYGRQGKLEYDFMVAPGVDPGRVRLRIEGAEKVGANGAGELVLETQGGKVVLGRPEAYQGSGARRRTVAVRYARRGRGEYGFEVGEYRKGEPLIIDPFLSYSTYLGGSGGDVADGIAVDSARNVYVTGMTGSANFPIKSAVQASPGGQGGVFVAKINAAGSSLVYSTFLGGSGPDSGAAIVLDASGSAYVVGSTSSPNFPVTAGAFQTSYGGNGDAFVAKLSATGSALSYASYLGGSAADFGQGVAVDASGNAYVTGSTQSPDFPTESPLQIGNAGCTTSVVYSQTTTTCTADAFVAKINAPGSALIYSTYLGGSEADSGQAIAIDAGGDAYVAGFTYSGNFPTQNALQSSLGGSADAFLTQLSTDGSRLVFSTYLGGSGLDQAFGLALDTLGNIFVAGGTQSPNFPTTAGVFQTNYGGNGDAFVTKLSAGGKALVYSTFIGGSGTEQANSLAVDSAGNVVVVGFTQSTDFPLVDPLQRILGISGAGTCGTSICPDAFVTKLSPSGEPVYSTYLGGAQGDVAQAVAVDRSALPYVAGGTNSSNFPPTVGVLQSAYAGVGASGNAFVAKIDSGDGPSLALTPQAVNFGNQSLNVSSSPQLVTVINPGSSPLQITRISASGDYAETDTCGTLLPAGSGTCTINITFTPKTAGSSTDQVTITDNAAGSPHNITVTGNGVSGGAGTLSLTPTKLVFPTVAIGSTSAAQVVQVVNNSQSAVTLNAISLTGAFAQTNNCGTLPSVLNPGGSCAVSVTFTPTASGSSTGSFSITDNAAGSPQTVSLSGTGGSPFTLSVTNPSSVIVVGTTAAYFTISASAASSFVSSISLSCSSGATCSFNPSSIYPGQSSTLTVSGLSATTANPDNFTVAGTSGSYKASVSLLIFLEDFSLSATPPLNSTTAGQSAQYTVKISPTNGFNQVVLLSCSGTLPPNTSCSWSPPGLTLNGSTASTATVTVTTTSQFTPGHGRPRFRFPGGGGRDSMPQGMIWISVVAMIMLLCRLLATNRKLVRKHAALMLAILAVFLLILPVASCNEVFFNPISPATPVGTPSGNYVIIITGTLGSNAQVTRSVTVNLTVGAG
jgi:beta-propeller repeat-containing protein/centrosomal CEP192-like protein/HYDIN/CFA65/VesB family protein